MSRGAATCPKCGSGNTKVTETRHSGKKTTRRHLCKNPRCGNKWRTVQELAVFVGWARR